MIGGSFTLWLSASAILLGAVFDCEAGQSRDFKNEICESILRMGHGNFRGYYIERHDVRGIPVVKESRYEEDSKSVISKVYLNGKMVSERKIPVANCPRSRSFLPAKYQWGEKNPKSISINDLWLPSRKDAREPSQVIGSKCKFAEKNNFLDVRMIANAVCGKPGNICDVEKYFEVGKYIIVEKIVLGTIIFSVSRYNEKDNSYHENVCYRNTCDTNRETQFTCENYVYSLAKETLLRSY